MSQSGLSHQIAAPEKELGTPVVQRLGCGVRITGAREEQLVHGERQASTMEGLSSEDPSSAGTWTRPRTGARHRGSGAVRWDRCR
ncbi:MAG TPA: hypothetical protein VJ914_38720 [Pseudonocardiaceae bacterium]|nr:hypothetical protein [Pseudonocardiaceae bacterium]